MQKRIFTENPTAKIAELDLVKQAAKERREKMQGK